MSKADGEKSTPVSGAPGTPEEDSRRDFLKTVGIGGIGVGLAAVAAGPAGAFVAYPLTHVTVTGSGTFVKVGKSAAFKPGEPVKVDIYADKKDAWNRILKVKIGSAWVVREGETLRAYSSVCPHLGCAFDYEADEKKFKCPCHFAAYTIDGKVAGGPAPRPLDALDVEEKDGIVSVRYQRFRLSVATKEVV
jgi:menaquinol-cytochrome c reductase iron-sulfur subunit